MDPSGPTAATGRPASELRAPDVADVRHLLELRSMLGDATHWASHAGPLQLTTAIVLLDGVVERAMHLAATSRGLHPTHSTDFRTLYSQVNGALTGWRPARWRDVLQLHLARNSAQHHGLTPDPAHIGPWVNATGAFVRRLVDAAFDLDLDRVALSDAVSDDELRSRLAVATAALNGGAAEGSVRFSMDTVDIAEKRWAALLRNPRAQRVSAVGGFTPLGTGRFRLDGSPRDPVEKVQADVEDLTREVRLSTFAQDPADVAWFARLRVEAEHVDLDDAARALAFATSWVLGYEAAVVGFTHDRRDRADRRARRERDDGGGPASLGQLLDVAQTLRGTSLTIRINDVPGPELFDAWRITANRLWADLDDAVPHRGEILPDGTVQLEVKDGATAQALQVLADALIHADAQLEADHASDAQQQARIEQARNEFDGSMSALGALPEWVASVDLEPMGLEGSGVSIHVVKAYEWLAGWHPRADAPDLRSLLGEDPRVETTAITDLGWLQITPTLAPSDVHELLWAVAPAICEYTTLVAQRDELRAQREQEVRRDIERVLADLSARTPSP